MDWCNTVVNGTQLKPEVQYPVCAALISSSFLPLPLVTCHFLWLIFLVLPHTQQMSKALNSTGRPMYFESCEWGVDNPWTWIKPLVIPYIRYTFVIGVDCLVSLLWYLCGSSFFSNRLFLRAFINCAMIFFLPCFLLR